MSEIAQIPPDCIPANPDIAGIGIRASFYAQNILTLAIAFSTMTDGNLTKAEARVLTTQLIVVFFTSYAFVMSATREVVARTISAYHVIVILNLGWINGLSAFLLLFLLYCDWFISRFAGRRGRAWRGVGQVLDPSQSRDLSVQGQDTIAIQDTAADTAQDRSSSHVLSFFSRQNIDSLIVIWVPAIIGSVYATILSLFGLWFWRMPDVFDTQVQCQPGLPIPIQILGHTIITTSPAVRRMSLVIYAALAIPVLNLFFVVSALFFPVFIILLCALFLAPVMHLVKRLSGLGFRLAFYYCFIMIFVMNVMIAVVTETMIQQMKSVVQAGESRWDYGQTLALALLILPIFDFFRSLADLVRVHRIRILRDIRRIRRGEGSPRDLGARQVEEGTRLGHGSSQEEEGPQQDMRRLERELEELEKRLEGLYGEDWEEKLEEKPEEELNSFRGLPRVPLQRMLGYHRCLQQVSSQGEAGAPAAPETPPHTSSPPSRRKSTSSRHNDEKFDTSTS